MTLPNNRARGSGFPAPQTLNEPRPVHVRPGPGGAPVSVGRHRVEHVRESWLIEDRWWTERPLRRRYWELVSAGGRNLVVFHELSEGRWYRHR